MRRRITILFFDVLLLCACYLAMVWCKPATVRIYLPHYTLPFIGFLMMWMFTSYFTDKYNIYKGKKIKDQLIAIIIGDFAAIGIGMFSIYLFKLDLPSRLIVVGTILTSFFLEIIFSIVLINYSKTEEEEEEKPAKDKKIVPAFFPDDQYELAQEEYPYLPFTGDKKVYAKLPYAEKLKGKYLAEIPGLYNFLARNIPIENVTKNNTLILNTDTLFNIEKCDENSQYLFINLHKINDIRRMNRFFIQVNQNLQMNGYYLTRVHPKMLRKSEIYKMFPPVLNGFVYIMDFLINRVLPKLPVTKQIYFSFSKGRNRFMSKAEAFGRLYSCGFEIIAEEIIENRLYFIARKIKPPLTGNEPTYGILVRLPRVGKDGKIIKVFKFRTMHPFSEYLQEYVYKMNKLDHTGKFHDDFRITRWGKFMRKVWIDELPMFLNILKGEMKLVGIRPISEHYMSLYAPEHKELRKKVRPGLLPPYYADLPKTLEEIQISEANYIQKYLKHPFSTDFTYFFRIFYNILFKRARSK